jgi:hypothetical protein
MRQRSRWPLPTAYRRFERWTVLVTRAFWYCFVEVPSGARHLFTGDVQTELATTYNNKRKLPTMGKSLLSEPRSQPIWQQ